jgi:hypothetical protein
MLKNAQNRAHFSGISCGSTASMAAPSQNGCLAVAVALALTVVVAAALTVAVALAVRPSLLK